ncbi:DNA-3-methyladenine glycosylase family protein [Guptibacillus algicola]|uniref:DNA-3-methyladenine glycosylase family protein n=1 Tax=Guptibacillus algicola TaxID=225844 RepID=UPI001CD3E081|nr:DNA-3-methyladenine glycosylase [Alkalihalobacillus algicola]MCA0989360.1 DNA-3-methyladenine glycosylase [Alkalihalobacillus algicola]
MWSEVVRPEAPYSIDRLFSRLSMDPLQAINRTDKEIKIPLVIDYTKEVITINAYGDENDPSFHISGELEEHKPTSIQKVKDMFDLEMDTKGIMEHFEGTELQDFVANYIGMPIICEPDTYSALMKNIVHQQLNMKFAYTLTYRFVTKYGENKNGVWYYPTPDVVNKLSVEELRELQFSNRKAEYIIDIAKKIYEGNLDLQQLNELTNQEVYDELLPLRGVGPWTIECVLLFGLGRKDILPAGDVGVQNAMKKLFDLSSKPSKEELYEYNERWSPYSSYISMYLWESLSG